MKMNSLTPGRSSKGLYQNDAWKWQTEVSSFCSSLKHASSLYRGSYRKKGNDLTNAHTNLTSAFTII